MCKDNNNNETTNWIVHVYINELKEESVLIKLAMEREFALMWESKGNTPYSFQHFIPGMNILSDNFTLN